MPDDEINLLDELDIGDEETDFGRGYARGVIEGRREAAEEWSKALGVAADVLLSMEAKRTALAEREARMEGTTDV